MSKIRNFVRSFFNHEFATVMGCMDGRAIHAMYWFFILNFGIKFVDSVTRPGFVGLTYDSTEFHGAKQWVVEVSVGIHKSKIVAIVGHGGCAGNQVSDIKQKEQTIAMAKEVAKWLGPEVKILGLWVPASASPNKVINLWEGQGKKRI